MASVMKLLRRIGGAKAAPTGGEAGELAIYKAGARPTDAMSLYAHDGTQWTEVLDTRGKTMSVPVFTDATAAPASPRFGDFWLNTGTNLLSIWDGATWLSTDPHPVATGTAAPTAPTSGALWLDPVKKELQVWDGTRWAHVAFTNVQNTFVQPQLIDVTSTSAALHIKQLGTGDALRIEDEANPDATPFVVTTNGNVGIGATPSAWGSGGNLELGSYQAISFKGAGCYISTNVYFDGSKFKYINSGLAASYSQIEGAHIWATAISGTANAESVQNETMRISPNGYVGIATKTPRANLEINSIGGWGGNNYGLGLYVSSSGRGNPAIGISDASGGNNFAIANAAGILTIASMPVVTDATTAPIERVKIEGTTGKVGINTAVHAAHAGMLAVSRTQTGNASQLLSLYDATAGATLDVRGFNDPAVGTGFQALHDGKFLGLGDGTTERIRIVAGTGNVGIGTTSPAARLDVNGNVKADRIVGKNATTFGSGFSIYWTGTGAQLWIDGANVGNITVASDYRIKTDVEDNTSEGLDRIKRLRPVTYRLKDYGEVYKGDDVHREGFIAHELGEIVPSAVEGAKDDPDQIQSLRLDALCSVMVKAIQELSAKVEALEAKLATTP